MDDAYSFSTPKAFEVIQTWDGDIPVTLDNYLSGFSFHPGTVRVSIQNVSDQTAYWAWGTASPANILEMGQIPPDGIIQVNWEEMNLNQLYVAGDDANCRLAVLQEGK